MKLLFYRWDSFTGRDVEEALTKLNIDYDIIEIATDQNVLYDETFDRTFLTKMETSNFTAVLSINYFFKIAKVCARVNIPYYAWSYDSPISIGEPGTLFFDTTHLFVFDREDYRYYKKLGVKNIYHLPLAVNTEKFETMKCSTADIKKYGGDISFVGQLYSLNINPAINTLPDYEKGYLNALLDAQLTVYGKDIISHALSDELLSSISRPDFLQKMSFTMYTDGKCRHESISRDAMYMAMVRSVTRKERILLLGLLSKKYHTLLFSYDSRDAKGNVDIRPQVMYETEMPKVFRTACINLNITLRSIMSGIPQRCLDIMANGGFLLSNYQEELSEYFKEGEEIALYSSIEEAVDKAVYYMKNPDIRKKLADKAHEKVKKAFRYEDRLKKILMP